MLFSDEEKKDLLCELRRKAALAASYSSGNQYWDIAFKVILLVVSLWIIVCGAAATATADRPAVSSGWSVASTILGGASTAIAAFAFSQFNFEQRQRIYRKKADSLLVLCDRLQFLNPDKEEFLRELALVDALNDYSPLSASVDLSQPDGRNGPAENTDG